MSNPFMHSIAVYHPSTSVDNGHYIRHFAGQGKDIAHFLDIMGRRDRYIITDDQENGLTMAVSASVEALSRAGLAGEDLDMIVFSTQTPEYTFPTNAILLHKALKGKNSAICLDSNSNCAGMLAAVEQAFRYMQSNPDVKLCLVAGSDYNSIHCNPDDEITYANYGDAAAAVILARSEVSAGRGFLDSEYYTDTSLVADNILFPACGTSRLYSGQVAPRDIQIRWTPFDGTVCVDPAVDSIRNLLRKHHLQPDEVRAYCFSQFSLKNIELIAEKLGLGMERFVYVGDEFGYTGTSSPFVALERAVGTGMVQQGDPVVFWSVGAGWQIATMLVTY